VEEFKDLAEGKFTALDTSKLARFEEIVSKFVVLKDTSELMMDLAYSALMLNSKELAEEVERLEESMDQMHKMMSDPAKRQQMMERMAQCRDMMSMMMEHMKHAGMKSDPSAPPK
jgi:uncharacterized protein with PhoU and TrkA domain